jgi:hypothetical protein
MGLTFAFELAAWWKKGVGDKVKVKIRLVVRHGDVVLMRCAAKPSLANPP